MLTFVTVVMMLKIGRLREGSLDLVWISADLRLVMTFIEYGPVVVFSNTS
jgi:hypothetical protein